MPEEIYKYTPLWNEWEIDEKIGKGSYGEVYKIHRDIKGKREYAAAKYISIPKEDDREYYEKNYTEEELPTVLKNRTDKLAVEISSMLTLKSAKNIVHYEDHLKKEKDGELGWDIIIRMELLTALEDYLNTHSFYKKDVIQLGIDICSAISSCKANHIIHRDIKIENIFLDNDGNYKLGDFGVSKVGTGTATGTQTGTKDYMAPEISKEHRYNETVDIYALGITMYRLLNNRRTPFIEADIVPDPDMEADAHLKRVTGEPMPPPKYADDELARIVLKACAFERHERYDAPEKMANELRRLLAKCEDIEVLKPRRRKAKTTEDPSTVSDIPSNSDQAFKDTESDMGGAKNGGTISDLPGNSSSPQKSKKPFWIAGVVALLCCIGVAIYIMIPRTIPITAITGLPDNPQMVVGDVLDLEPSILPVNHTTEQLTYTSSDQSIAEVNNNGEIIAKAAGDVVITVQGDDIIKKLNIHISEQKIPVTEVTGMPANAELEVGAFTTIQCRVVPEDATEQTITYTSSDPNIATIGQDGVLTAVAAGQVTITASADGVQTSMVLTVNAPAPVETPTPTRNNTNTSSGSSNNTQRNNNSGGSNNNSSGTSTNHNPPVNDTPPAVVNDTPPVVNDAPSTNNSGGASNNSEGGNSDREIANPGFGYY